MANSLKVLLDRGQYELVAYRLVYALVKAQIERGSGKNGRRPRSATVLADPDGAVRPLAQPEPQPRPAEPEPQVRI